MSRTLWTLYLGTLIIAAGCNGNTGVPDADGSASADQGVADVQRDVFDGGNVRSDAGADASLDIGSAQNGDAMDLVDTSPANVDVASEPLCGLVGAGCVANSDCCDNLCSPYTLPSEQVIFLCGPPLDAGPQTCSPPCGVCVDWMDCCNPDPNVLVSCLNNQCVTQSVDGGATCGSPSDGGMFICSPACGSCATSSDCCQPDSSVPVTCQLSQCMAALPDGGTSCLASAL